MKRFLQLLCALAFCLALTPATALAAAPNGQVIYVGNENVTSGGYWTTGSDGTVTQYTGPDTPADNYVHYDADTNTLTLHNATIKKGLDYNENITGGTFIIGSAIGVFNESGAAELTITLEGTNTIAEVGKGIYVLATSTGGATLTITGDGSLDASASQTGIWVQSNSGDAALSIENAKVAATVVDGYGSNGVFVQSSENSPVSLTVDGGSLTAAGRYANDAGILLQFGSGGSGSGTPTVTVGNNAIIRANGGIANNSTNPIQFNGNGIVFDGNKGTVYGSVELQEDLTIGGGETLTIPQGSTLNTNNNLTNNGIIVNTGGTLNGEPGGTGTIETAPIITKQPESQTVAENATAKFTVEATGGNLSYQWQQSTDNGHNWTDINGVNSDTYTTEAATTDMNGRQYRCIVSNNAGSVTSEPATLTVNQHEHEWGEPAWTWSEDGKTATATFTCAECDETQNVKATVTPTVKTDPTCTGNGTTTYTATATLDGKDYTATKDVADIPATGHKWSGPNWSWNGTTATATFTCKNDNSHTQTVTATVTSTVKTDPTCTEDGVTEYTATVKHDGTTYTATKNITIPATGHDWGEPAWTWDEDGKTATATFTCKNDASHTDIVTAAVTSAVTTDPTCTEDGVTEYTATVKHDGTTYTATKNVADIPATGHDWGEDGHCTICDAVKPGFMPEIIQGDEATWTKGDGQPLSFTSNAAYADFQEARVDGQTLDPVHYTVEQGSTIVTLKAAYLESLDPGEHTLDIVSSTGTATATFTITAKETQQPAKPADTDRTPAKSAGDGGQLSRSGSDIMPAVATLAILMASGLVLGTLTLRRSRR